MFRTFETLSASASYCSVTLLCLTSPFRSRSMYSSVRIANACLFYLHEQIPVHQLNRTSRESGPTRVCPLTKSFTRPEEAHGGRSPIGRPPSSFKTSPLSRRNARRAPLSHFFSTTLAKEAQHLQSELLSPHEPSGGQDPSRHHLHHPRRQGYHHSGFARCWAFAA